MLRQIERQFQQERGRAWPLRSPSSPREASRNAKRAAVGFVIGLLALLVSFASSWVVGLVGFLAMLACAVALVQNLRSLASAHWRRPPALGGEVVEDGGPASGPGWLGRWRDGWRGPGSGHDQDSLP